MLARYRIYRGKRPGGDPLPTGTRHDTRKHTRHCLRPEARIVFRYLADPSDEAWERFERDYLALLASRFERDREPFDDLARRAREGDVHIGCNCPTAANPDVRRCHTFLALRFMKMTYPELTVVFPAGR